MDTERAWWHPRMLPGITPTVIRRFLRRELLLLQQQGGLLADHGDEFLGELRQQPRQRHLEPHVVLEDVDEAGRVLAARGDVEREPVAGPGLVVDRQQAGIIPSRVAEASLDAARGLLASELMGDLYDQRLRHLGLLQRRMIRIVIPP